MTKTYTRREEATGTLGEGEAVSFTIPPGSRRWLCFDWLPALAFRDGLGPVRDGQDPLLAQCFGCKLGDDPATPQHENAIRERQRFLRI